MVGTFDIDFCSTKQNYFIPYQAGAEFSFDYLLLVILAGIIAFMGLLENSSVVLVASMLVSPIMGENLTKIRSDGLTIDDQVQFLPEYLGASSAIGH